MKYSLNRFHAFDVSEKIRFLARILINKPLLTTFVFVLCKMSTLHDYAIRCRMCFVTDVWHESLQKNIEIEMARWGYFYKMEMVITSYSFYHYSIHFSMIGIFQRDQVWTFQQNYAWSL